MKTEHLILLAVAGAAIYMLTRRTATRANGWRDAGGGVSIDPSGNYWQGNQMIWKAPGWIDVGQGGALSKPVYEA
jgi:hypothetical protein